MNEPCCTEKDDKRRNSAPLGLNVLAYMVLYKLTKDSTVMGGSHSSAAVDNTKLLVDTATVKI